MPARWNRVHNFQGVVLGQIQAVSAKAHLTVFRRSPSAPGAGDPAQKAKFTRCAHATKGIADRMERNVKMQTCLGGAAKAKAKAAA